MKVSILTLHSVCNYGTQLQSYATQEKFKEYFDEVDFIDYRRSDTYGLGLINTFSKGNFLRALAILPTIAYWKFIFGGFQKNNLHFWKKRHLNDITINNVELDSDACIVGSDQVWNSGWNKGIIPAMYLGFVPFDIPKYSYSSSFGREKLPLDEVEGSKKYLKEFRMLSVREQSGVNILKEQFGCFNVEKIIDPTLIMTADFWRKKTGKRKIKEKYILIYNLNRSKEFDEYAKQISNITGYKLYRFCTRFDQIFRNGKSLVIPKIFDFINYVDNAEYVITDSFHATAFSMNLNTQPICVYPNEYSNRLSEFLKLVDAEECRATSYSDFEVINRKPCFSRVNDILNQERKKADDYLTRIKEDIEVKQ